MLLPPLNKTGRFTVHGCVDFPRNVDHVLVSYPCIGGISLTVGWQLIVNYSMMQAMSISSVYLVCFRVATNDIPDEEYRCRLLPTDERAPRWR